MGTGKGNLAAVIVAALAIGLPAGCSTVEPGRSVPGGPAQPSVSQPAPTQSSPTRSTSAAPTEPTSRRSVRPRPIDLAGVDVCQTLETVDPAKYGLDYGGAVLGGDSQVFPGAEQCFAAGIRANLGLTITAVTTEGYASYVGSVRGQVTEGTAAGYPMAVVKPARQAFCFAVVDAADGQLVHLSYGVTNPTTEPVTPQPTLCERAARIAEAVMATLLA